MKFGKTLKAATDAENPIGLKIPGVKTEKLKAAEDLIEAIRATDERMEREFIQRREELKQTKKEEIERGDNSATVEEAEDHYRRAKIAEHLLENMGEKKDSRKVIHYLDNDEVRAAFDEMYNETIENNPALSAEGERILSEVLEAEEALRDVALKVLAYNQKVQSYFSYIADVLKESNMNPHASGKMECLFVRNKDLKKFMDYVSNTSALYADFEGSEYLFGYLNRFNMLAGYLSIDPITKEETNVSEMENVIISEKTLRNQKEQWAYKEFKKGFHTVVPINDGTNKTRLEIEREAMSIRKDRGENWYDPETFEFHEAENEEKAREFQKKENERNWAKNANAGIGDNPGITFYDPGYGIFPPGPKSGYRK